MMRRLAAALFVLSTARTQLPAQTQAVHAYKVQGSVWMIVGAGANIAMQAGKEGIFLVDTGAAGTAYRATCKNHDQYDSILACEAAAGEENAMARTRMAGPGVVDTVMMDFGKVDGCQ